jgi:hypothetical protein
VDAGNPRTLRVSKEYREYEVYGDSELSERILTSLKQASVSFDEGPDKGELSRLAIRGATGDEGFTRSDRRFGLKAGNGIPINSGMA